MRTSLVGALLGAHVGLKGIPKHFIEGLEDHENIIALAKRVSQDAVDRVSSVPSDTWRWPSGELPAIGVKKQSE